MGTFPFCCTKPSPRSILARTAVIWTAPSAAAGIQVLCSRPPRLTAACWRSTPTLSRCGVGVDLIAAHGFSDRLTVVQSRFSALQEIARQTGFLPLDGIMLDLGFSSFQLDDPDRGFAFRNDGPLDMRFNPDTGRSARSIVNDASREEIAICCDGLVKKATPGESREQSCGNVGRAQSARPLGLPTL